MRRIDIIGVIISEDGVVMVATILTYRVFGVVCVAVVVVRVVMVVVTEQEREG